MPKHSEWPATSKVQAGFEVQTEVPEDVPATTPIVTPDTPPMEANPLEPAPTPTPEPSETDPATAPSPEPSEDLPEPDFESGPQPVEDEEPVVEPSPEPPAEERPVSEGDKPVESIPVGSVAERAVTFASKIDDENVRTYVLHALADQKVFSKDWDVRYRMETANVIREMMRWIRTNVPASASFKTFMEGVNNYLLMVETQGIPSMWSEESASAPLDEIQARKAAMAIERAVEHLDMSEEDEPEEDREKAKKAKKKLATTLKKYAQKVREGKIK